MTLKASIQGAFNINTAPSRAKISWGLIFGYDIFISFALGNPPRGTRNYASDLARRLRENGFVIFFSDDEAPAGYELDPTIRKALRRSRSLVVIANHGTLEEPGYVRTEVQEYKRARPNGVIIVINVDNALQNPNLKESTRTWLPFENRIWIDETEVSCDSGQVADDVLRRLVTTPRAMRSISRIRITLTSTFVVLLLLLTLIAILRHNAVQERDGARAALLASSARQALLLARDGRTREGWDELVGALAQARPDVNGPLPEGFLDAALTTLVEDRRGPDLLFDTSAPAPPEQEEGGNIPLAWTFDARGALVAVAAGAQVAVWATADGHRLMQTTLPFVAEKLTFAADGALVIAEGVEPPPEGKEGSDTPHAAAVDVASGRVTELPLTLCRQWVPCITGPGKVKQLRPLAELPANGLPPGTAFVAAAADETWVEGVSGERFMLLRRESTEGSRSWWLVDYQSGGALELRVPIKQAAPGEAPLEGVIQYSVAKDAPVLVASSFGDPTLMVFPIRAGPAAPQLVYERSRQFKAPLAAATQGAELDPNGTKLRYQNFRYGTGTGVGQGRTTVIDLDSGRELWARGEGEVAWGEHLVALQEYWAETQLLTADTGATWFSVPGNPMGFDPTGRMLLMWDMEEGGLEGSAKASPWSRVWLLETLPVRQYARDPQGPASTRSACVWPQDLRFLALGERYDRLWNRDDWHRTRQTGAEEAKDEVALATVPEQTRVQWVNLTPRGKRWQLHAEDEGKDTMLDAAQVREKFPLLAADLRSGKDLRAVITTSADGHWGAVVVSVADEDTTCEESWARWRLHSGHDPTPVKAGCTTGELPGPGELPAVWFLPAKGSAPQLAAVPADTCRYEVLEPEGDEVRASVIPAFGNNVRLERLTSDLLAVYSTDWDGVTSAFQLQTLDSAQPGPVFMLAESNDGGDDAAKPAALKTASRTLFHLRTSSENGSGVGYDVNFAPDGRTLDIRGSDRTAILGVPPWGERLRDRLRQAVQARQRNAR